MNRVAYLLHLFPRITDTFIKREIRSLQNLGTYVKVISIWKPKEPEITPAFSPNGHMKRSLHYRNQLFQ